MSRHFGVAEELYRIDVENARQRANMAQLSELIKQAHGDDPEIEPRKKPEKKQRPARWTSIGRSHRRSLRKGRRQNA